MRFADYGKMDFPVSHAFGTRLRASIRKVGRTSGLGCLGFQFHGNGGHIQYERRELVGTISRHFPRRLLQLDFFCYYRISE